MICPLTGRTGHPRLRRDAVDLRAPRPGGDDDLLGIDAPGVAQRQSADTATFDQYALDRRARPQHRAGLVGRGGERRAQRTRIGRMILWNVERESQRGRQRGLQGTRLRAEQARDGQAEPLAQRELALQPLGLVTVAGDDERAARPVADGLPGDVLKLGGEGRPASRRLQAEGRQRALPGVGLAHRSQHPGGHARGAAAERAAVEHADGQPARTRAPRDGQAAGAAADDGDVVARVLRM